MRDLCHVLRKMKAELLYHYDHEAASLYQTERFPDFRFPIFPYSFDSAHCLSRQPIYNNGIHLDYRFEKIALLVWGHLHFIVQFGLDGQCYNTPEFTRILEKEEETRNATVWVRVNRQPFDIIYTDFEKRISWDGSLKEEPAILFQEFENNTKKGNVVPFKATPGYTRITVRGRQYKLSPRRAEALKLIHEYYKDGNLPVHQDEILRKLSDQHPSESLKDLFKDSPLWNSVVVPLGNGMINLQLPENS